MAKTQTKNQKIRAASRATVKIDIWTKIAEVAYKVNQHASKQIFKHIETRDILLDSVISGDTSSYSNE